jgi:X-X-X-Leu-X-X-Gly heptad repeat protein
MAAGAADLAAGAADMAAGAADLATDRQPPGSHPALGPGAGTSPGTCKVKNPSHDPDKDGNDRWLNRTEPRSAGNPCGR